MLEYLRIFFFILLEDNVRHTDMQICVCMRSPVSACLICLFLCDF